MNNLPKLLSLILAAFTVFLLLAPAGMGASIRGLTVDTNEVSAEEFCWDATTFGAFCYPVNKHQNFVNDSIAWGERLRIENTDITHGAFGTSGPSNHVLDEEELVYSTKQFSCKYKLVSELGLSGDSIPEDMGSAFYWKLPFFAKPYIAIENDATQLSSIVCMQGGSDKKTLRTGETWDLGKGYSLTVHQVDAEGNKVWFSLEKDGEEIESAIVEANGTVESQAFTATADFGDGNDQLYFVTYVDSVFMGSVDSLAVFKYTWLVDKDNVLVIENGDEYQGLEVKETSETGLVLKNPDTITIDVDSDKKTYFTDSWYFQTSDDGKGTGGIGYILYPAMDVTIEDELVSESAENDVSEIVEVPLDETNSTSDSPGSKASPAPQVRESDSAFSEPDEGAEGPDEESSEKSPGFGLLTCILGIGAGFVRRN